VLPIAIAAKVDDLRSYAYQPWELVYDSVSGILRRKHFYGEPQRWVVRRIRVDEPQDMVEPASVPFDKRDDAPWETARRRRQEQVAAIANRFVAGDPPGFALGNDFDLERDVLDELWRRWREVTADGFLTRSLMGERS
jgi:hypothetical protein